jgi:hypothetical protein
MGIQGPIQRSAISLRAANGRYLNNALVFSVLVLTPALAGCSSFSSSTAGSAPAVYQPASAPANAAAAPPGDPTASMTPYPSRSLVDLFTGDSQPTATVATNAAPASAPSGSPATYAPPRPGMPHPPSTYTASAPPYQAQPGQPGYDAYASSSGAQAKPAPVAAQDDSAIEVPGYASKSLVDIFSK